jgi:methyl-accepting chemotaxis protein
MTDDELRSLVGSLATATARNTESIDSLAHKLNDLTDATASNTQVVDSLAHKLNDLTDATASNTQVVDSLARRFEDIRENMTYNTQAVADGLELAAAANRTAAAAMELSANTSRNLDRLEQDIAELKQIVGIAIDDSRADRTRIRNLEEPS